MAKFLIETGDDNEILRSISDTIRNDEIRKYKSLAEDMVKYVKNVDNGAVGLAAPQIGVNKRLIAVSLMQDYEDENFRTIAMINPEITEHTEETCSDKEGCLSVPGKSGEVERWTGIKVTFLDPDGKKYVMKLSNLSARIVQHEVDHLDGILFTDKVNTPILQNKKRA
ncbi:MAG: peptide deformylase [Candidatus Gracilibacteria bacterium]|nr:peptide deformylase [Candidatus Gracilibacteria bacterium]